ncbi:MAG: protein-export chaperone SecB [Cellvibrionaceae bacterium]
MAEENQVNEQAAQEGNEQQFSLQRIYIKDLSYESPLGVAAFNQNWKPQVNQEINTKNAKVGEDAYEVVLSLTITVKLDDKVAFLIELQQAGIFAIKGIENNQIAHILNTMCLQILFPYARETIDSVIIKGSFPALMLPPINFDALYAQAVAQQQEKSKDDAPTVN